MCSKPATSVRPCWTRRDEARSRLISSPAAPRSSPAAAPVSAGRSPRVCRRPAPPSSSRPVDASGSTSRQPRSRALTGNPVEADVVDIRHRETVEALASRHQVDILVNNAGGQFPQKARDYSPNGWRSVIDLNLNGTWTMTQVFGNQMLDGDGGSIVQIVAIVGRGMPGIAHSSAARAGVVELSRTLAFEWGPKVRVNCVAPGAFRTDGWEATYDEGVGNDMSGVPLPVPGPPERRRQRRSVPGVTGSGLHHRRMPLRRRRHDPARPDQRPPHRWLPRTSLSRSTSSGVGAVSLPSVDGDDSCPHHRPARDRGRVRSARSDALRRHALDRDRRAPLRVLARRRAADVLHVAGVRRPPCLHRAPDERPPRDGVAPTRSG